MTTTEQNEWDLERLSLFKAEIIKLFVSFNKPMQDGLVKMKAELTAETLSTLKTNMIQEFFAYVRETEQTLPTDGQLKRILSANYARFSGEDGDFMRIDNQEEMAPPHVFKEFARLMQLVSSGHMTSLEAKTRLNQFEMEY